jgi:hypothetical protein
MMLPPSNDTAGQDQFAAAIRDLDQRWPYNRHFVAFPRRIPVFPKGETHPDIFDVPAIRRILYWYAEQCEQGSNLFERYDVKGIICIVWLADDAVTTCTPSFDMEWIVREFAPWKSLECDRCERKGDAGGELHVQSVLLIPQNARLFGFGLCGVCTYEFEQDDKTHLVYKERR